MLYESLLHPLTILSTLPPASVGEITHSELDVMSIIGIILLIGIVKRNAIMMIDFALSAERNEGKSTRESIFLASTLRFRPILMTTMAALFGDVPLALGTGMGSELRRPLGISIIGGIGANQLRRSRVESAELIMSIQRNVCVAGVAALTTAALVCGGAESEFL